MQSSNDQQQQQGQPPNYSFFSANPVPPQPTYNASPSILNTLSQDELRRHQLSSNGTTPSDPYATARIAMFPVAGARRPYGSSSSQGQAVPGSTYAPWPIDASQSTMPQSGANAGNISLNDSSTHSSPTRRATALSGEAAGFEEFLAEMPLKSEDAARHSMFTELIRMKTKSIELQIAEARRKEKEAEVELARWRVASDQRIAQTAGDTGSNVTPSAFDGMGMNPFDMERGSVDSTAAGSSMFQQSNAPSTVQQTGPAPANGLTMNIPPPENPPTPITQFDLEAMMHDSNLEGLFSWLPDFATQHQQQQQQMPQPAQQQQQQQQQMPPPQQPDQSLNQQSLSSLDANNFLFGNMSTPYLTTNESLNTPSIPYNTITSPVKRSASPMSDNEATSPHVKRSKKSNEKKIVVERSASCSGCGKTIGRVMFRAPRAHMPDDISVDLKCPECAAVDAPATLPDPATMGSSIGTVEMRKRMRATLETEDEEKRVFVRRQFCDVCQRVVGSGRLVAGAKENMSSIAEIVCAPCDAKYQRCTDCGGGGGPRIGIGKWRMKQVFPLGRKTCSLSHTRLGDRPREIGVHVTPSDFSPEQLKEVLTRTKGLWNEKTLARLAVPEMLEIDLPPDVINPLRDYADVEDIITRNWPTREAMIKADGADPARFKRLLGLIWAHPKSRRAVRTVDLEEEEYARTADDDEADMSTVLANVKRTNVVIPPGSELVGMWGGEWDMKHGALLITTLIPFEGADGEDSTALSVGEMITTVQGLRSKINDERRSQAAQQGKQPDLVPQCEHLWVVSGGTMPLVRERVADFLIRKRSFVHVEEYLTRHPDFIHALKARPVGLHPDLHRPIRSANGEEDEIEARPLVLVRWLGKDFDAAKIREIKLQEFGGKAKLKGKKAKGKV